jgi:AcrR family transcriptional regulator
MDNDIYTRHDRRRDRTRSHLQDALIDLVLERGIEEIVIQDITDRADVGRGTFYFHFESKEDVLWSIVQDRFPLPDKNGAGLLDAEMDQPEYYQYVNRFRHYEKNKEVFLAIMGTS